VGHESSLPKKDLTKRASAVLCVASRTAAVSVKSRGPKIAIMVNVTVGF